MKLRKKEYKNMKTEELEAKLLEARKELMKENAQVARGTTPKSPGALRLLKKSIARIHTLIGEKQRARSLPQKKE